MKSTAGTVPGAAIAATPAGPAFVQGAEATVTAVAFLGRACVVKRRVAKTYRHASLDDRLRDERTRDEAHLLLRCRQAGVPVPVVYDIDRAAGAITMELVPGPQLRDVLPGDDDATAAARMHALGTIVARMHAAGVTHGDLTTSNILVPGGDEASLVVIDFGLGQATHEAEGRGVDLHLVEEALQATEARAEALFAAFLAGYDGWPGAASAVRRLEAIRLRGRYREAV